MSERQDPVRATEQGSLTRSTITGVLWITAGRLIKTPVNLVVIAILARLLTPADFGIVAVAYTVAGLATLLVDGSFGMVLVQRREVDSGIIGASLLLSAALGAAFGIVIIGSSSVIQRFFAFPELSEVLVVLGVMLPVNGAAAVWTALLQRTSNFRVLTINSAVAQLVNGAVAITMALTGFGLWALVWAQVIGTVTEALLGYVASRKSYETALNRRAIREVLRSGGMFTLTKMFNWAAGNIDRVVIGRILGAAALGFYSRASNLMLTANQLVGTGTMRVLFSTFSRMQDDRARMAKAFDRALSTSVLGSTLVSAFMVLFSELVVKVLLGGQWTAAVPLIQVLFAAFVSRSGYIVAEAVPLSLGLGRSSALRQGAQFVLVVGGATVGARYGVLGAAIGIALAYWIFYMLCLVLVVRLLPIGAGRLARIHLNGILIAAVPVLSAFAADYLLQPGTNLLLMMIPPTVFGAVAVAVLALAPQALLSDDVARLRRQAFSFAASRLPARRAAE